MKKARTLTLDIESMEIDQTQEKIEGTNLKNAFDEATKRKNETKDENDHANQMVDNCQQAETKKEVEQLKKKLDEAKKLDVELNKFSLELSQNLITEEAIKKLRDAQQKLDQQLTHLDASRPKLFSKLSNQGQQVVTLNNSLLNQDTPVLLSGKNTINLGDLGNLIIEAYNPIDAQEKYDRATEILTGLLSNYHVENLEDAEKKNLRRRSLERNKQISQAELNSIAPEGLDHLSSHHREKRYKYDQRWHKKLDAKTLHSLPSLSEALSRQHHAQKKYDKASTKREEAKNKLDEFDKRKFENIANIKKNQRIRDALHSELGKPDSWNKKRDELDQQLQKVEKKIIFLDLKIEENEGIHPTLEETKANVQRLERTQQVNSDNLNKKKVEEAKLETRIERILENAPGENLAELTDLQAKLQARRTSFVSHIEALNLLKKELQKSQKTLREKFLQPVSDQLLPLLNIVLPDTKVSLGEQLAPETLTRRGLEENTKQLSIGTQEQLAVLTRLAFALLMAQHDRRMPVILDDALAWCDDHRLEKMFQVLDQVAPNIQCIIFTCHENSFSHLGAPILQATPWGSLKSR